eukprot:sb/3464578/
MFHFIYQLHDSTLSAANALTAVLAMRIRSGQCSDSDDINMLRKSEIQMLFTHIADTLQIYILFKDQLGRGNNIHGERTNMTIYGKPIRTRYLGHVTGYQPISDQYFLIRSWYTCLHWVQMVHFTHIGCGENHLTLPDIWALHCSCRRTGKTQTSERIGEYTTTTGWCLEQLFYLYVVAPSCIAIGQLLREQDHCLPVPSCLLCNNVREGDGILQLSHTVTEQVTTNWVKGEEHDHCLPVPSCLLCNNVREGDSPALTLLQSSNFKYYIALKYSRTLALPGYYRSFLCEVSQLHDSTLSAANALTAVLAMRIRSGQCSDSDDINMLRKSEIQMLLQNTIHGHHVTHNTIYGHKTEKHFPFDLKHSQLSRLLPPVKPGTDRNKLTTNQNSLFRSRDWLSANQGPVFPDSVGSWIKYWIVRDSSVNYNLSFDLRAPGTETSKQPIRTRYLGHVTGY